MFLLFVALQIIALGLEAWLICMLMGLAWCDPFGALAGIAIFSSSAAAMIALLVSWGTLKGRARWILMTIHGAYLLLVVVVIVYAATAPPRKLPPGPGW